MWGQFRATDQSHSESARGWPETRAQRTNKSNESVIKPVTFFAEGRQKRFHWVMKKHTTHDSRSQVVILSAKLNIRLSLLCSALLSCLSNTYKSYSVIPFKMPVTLRCNSVAEGARPPRCTLGQLGFSHVLPAAKVNFLDNAEDVQLSESLILWKILIKNISISKAEWPQRCSR